MGKLSLCCWSGGAAVAEAAQRLANSTGVGRPANRAACNRCNPLAKLLLRFSHVRRWQTVQRGEVRRAGDC
jgi:hypothetical protein